MARGAGLKEQGRGKMQHFIGVDVGTGSARAGVFDAGGQLLGTAQAAITTQRPRADFAQQHSQGIWAAVTAAVRAAMGAAGVAPETVAGLGFDATCSLVVTDAAGGAVSVCPEGAADQDVILWMDHRAIAEAAEINATKAEVLAHVGGVISPEMEMPKLLWLKRHLPESWAQAAQFWDLPDWLVHRATGATTRSLCSAVCKWTYLGHRGTAGEGWDDAFLAAIGLSDLTGPHHAKIGESFAAPGARIGTLSAAAAAELGLAPGTPVASGMIDAYAGALGTLGVGAEGADLAGRLAVIAGTSACHIALTEAAVFVPGVWGPYFSVLVPGLWANEGGQSAAGALIDTVIDRHGAAAEARVRAGREGVTIHAILQAELTRLAAGADTARLTAGRHIQPDFHGNRSPLADPTRHGAISGLTLDHGLADLALDYLAVLQALAYGTRHILQEMTAAGLVVDVLVLSGGLARNPLYLREMADATGCRIVVPDQAEPVLLGSAMMAAVAADAQPDLPQAMRAMGGPGAEIAPRADLMAYHDRKYQVFRRMQADFAAYAAIMGGD
jgi:FGGY-family pentulose kinase